MFAESAFGEDSAWRLKDAGLRWDYAVNLLPRARGRSTWDRDEAERVASYLTRMKFARYILAGRRVASAFGLERRVIPFLDGPYLVVPHPSGLSRSWNDPSVWSSIAALLLEAPEASSTAERTVEVES